MSPARYRSPAGAAAGVPVRFIPLRGACAPRYCYAAPPSGGALILPRRTPRGIFHPRTACAKFPAKQSSPCEARSSRRRMPPSSPPLRPLGCSSPWAQPILHYERKLVLHSARKSGLHYEQRELFSTPHHTYAPLFAAPLPRGRKFPRDIRVRAFFHHGTQMPCKFPPKLLRCHGSTS